MRKLLLLVMSASLCLAAAPPPMPPGYPVPLWSPRDASNHDNARMVRRERLLFAAPSTLPLVTLIVRGWKTYPWGTNTAMALASPGLALQIRTNAPFATVYSSADLTNWACWTTLSNIRSNEVRDVGYCPTPNVQRMFLKVILHD